MKKTISAFLALTFIALSSGCASYDGTSEVSQISGENIGEGSQISAENSSAAIENSVDTETPPKNLDLTNTAIIENEPATGKWQKFTFVAPGLDERSADRIIKFASNYGSTVDKSDILLMLYKRIGDAEWVPLDKEAEAILAKYNDYKRNDNMDNFPYFAAYYHGDVYIEVQGATGGMIELDYRSNVNSVLDIDLYPDSTRVGSWRPNFSCTDAKYIDPNDESITCVLNGKTVNAAEVIKNAEKNVAENDILFPGRFGAKVLNAALYTYENGNQGLGLNFEYTIDGVPLEGSSSFPIYDENGERYKAYTIELRTAMLTENTFDWIWFPVIDGGTDFTIEDCDAAISLEKACEIVSEKLSREYTFNVAEIELKYAATYADDYMSSSIEPTWRFYLTGIKAQEFSSLYVYVNAVDGTVQISELM